MSPPTWTTAPGARRAGAPHRHPPREPVPLSPHPVRPGCDRTRYAGPVEPGASHIPASGRGEDFAALEPARLEDVLAARRRHPGPKPVDAAPVSFFGLERSLHGEGPPGRTLYSLPTAR